MEEEVEKALVAPIDSNYGSSQNWAVEKQGTRPTLLYPFFKFDNPILSSFQNGSNKHRRPGTAAFQP